MKCTQINAKANRTGRLYRNSGEKGDDPARAGSATLGWVYFSGQRKQDRKSQNTTLVFNQAFNEKIIK